MPSKGCLPTAQPRCPLPLPCLHSHHHDPGPRRTSVHLDVSLSRRKLAQCHWHQQGDAEFYKLMISPTEITCNFLPTNTALPQGAARPQVLAMFLLHVMETQSYWHRNATHRDFKEMHLYIHGNTTLYIKHKVQLNYASFTAIVFIEWKHSGGQAIQTPFNTYIFHRSVTPRCTAQLTFGQSCWKSCEIILKIWKTSPDRHSDSAMTGDRQIVRQRNNPATSCDL